MKTDNQLILEAKNGSNEALIELKNRHEKLFYSVCQKFSKMNNNFKYNDAISDVYYVIFECIKSFKPNKNVKFSTYLGHMSRFYCLNSQNYKSKSKFKLFISNNEIPTDHSEIDLINIKNNCVHEDVNHNENDYIFDLLEQMKDNRVKKIFNLRFLSGERKTSWKNIAKQMNLSTTHCINIFNRAKNLLLNKITSKNINDKL